VSAVLAAVALVARRGVRANKRFWQFAVVERGPDGPRYFFGYFEAWSLSLRHQLESMRPQAPFTSPGREEVKLRCLARSDIDPLRAFSSEVDTGSREENASIQESRASVLIQSEPEML
jgi:hypothetical protein